MCYCKWCLLIGSDCHLLCFFRTCESLGVLMFKYSRYWRKNFTTYHFISILTGEYCDFFCNLLVKIKYFILKNCIVFYSRILNQLSRSNWLRIALVVTLRNELVIMSGYAFNCASKQSLPRENGSVYRHRLHLMIGEYEIF